VSTSGSAPGPFEESLWPRVLAAQAWAKSWRLTSPPLSHRLCSRDCGTWRTNLVKCPNCQIDFRRDAKSCDARGQPLNAEHSSRHCGCVDCKEFEVSVKCDLTPTQTTPPPTAVLRRNSSRRGSSVSQVMGRESGHGHANWHVSIEQGTLLDAGNLNGPVDRILDRVWIDRSLKRSMGRECLARSLKGADFCQNQTC
jgi:hypothetical protein